MAHSSSDYTLQKLVVDSLEEDGALCNAYSKEYDEQGTLDGGTGNRAVFKKYNDKITSYHKILKVLTGEQRANISEGIPAIDFLHTDNTSMMYTYPLNEDGTVDASTIIPIPEDSTKSAIDYLEEDDPYILNRALSGSDLRSHFYNTDGNLISDSNVQVSSWLGDFAFVYKGISNPAIVNPKDNTDIYKSLRHTSIFSTKATTTSWIEIDFADRETPAVSDPQEITTANISTCVDSTGNPFVVMKNTSTTSTAVVYLEEGDIAVAFPDSSYSTDDTKLLIFKTNSANNLTGSTTVNSYLQFVIYVNSFNMSSTPDETTVDSAVPDYLATDYFSKYLNLYGVFNKEYYAKASGLLNGAFCEPCEYETTAEGKQKVTKWKFNDDKDSAAEKGVPLEVGDKYFKGHILKRGNILDAPLKTTNTAEASYDGKATFIYDKVAGNISGLFKNIQIDTERWQNFTLKEVEEVTNKADYSGESLSAVQAADYLGLQSGNTTLSTSNMIYPDKLKTTDGVSISYDQIREIIEKCTTSEMHGPRIQDDTLILDLTNPNDGVTYDIDRVENGTVLNWGWIKNKTKSWNSEKNIYKNYDVEWYANYDHRHTKEKKWGKVSYPFSHISNLSVKFTSPINIFSKKNNTSADVVLVYPEYNKYFPENFFLISRTDLGLEKYEGSAIADYTPSQTKKGFCSFYNVKENCVASFRVESVSEFKPSKVRYVKVCDNVDSEVGTVWSGKIPYYLGSTREVQDSETGAVTLDIDTSNDCYIYVLSPMEMSLENITIYDKDNQQISLTGSDGKVSIVPMSYPANYFPVTITTDNDGNNRYVIDSTNRTTDIKKLKGSYIIPGVPEFSTPEDLRQIRHNGSGLSMGIFADLFGSGLESVTSTVLKKGIYRTLYDWPVSTGDAGNNVSNPILLGDLKDTLNGLSDLGPSLRKIAEGNTFTVGVDGNLRGDYTYQGNAILWNTLLNIASASKPTSTTEGTKKKILSGAPGEETNVVYECYKDVTAVTKELADSNYWGNYWQKYTKSKINWSTFKAKTSATLGTAYQIITEPEWSGVTLNCVLICKQDYTGITLTESNYTTYWYVIPSLDTWADLLAINNVTVAGSDNKLYQILGRDVDGYEYNVYTYIATTDLTHATANLEDSNYWSNYWRKKNSSTWLELLNCTSAVLNDVFYITDADPEGNISTYYGCIQRVTHACNNDPTSPYYWAYFWKKRKNLTTKTVSVEDLDNLYNRIDYDSQSTTEYNLTVDLDRNSSNWEVVINEGDYKILGDTLITLIKRRLENCVVITKATTATSKPRPSFRKLEGALDSIFGGNARITRDACQTLDDLLGNNTRAFLNFGDASNPYNAPEELVNLEEDLYDAILNIILESDRDIKDASEVCEKSRIDYQKSAAYTDIATEAGAYYDSTVYYDELQKVLESQQAREAWDDWSENDVVKKYYTTTARTIINTTAANARGILGRIKDGLGTSGLVAFARGYTTLSLNEFINLYQLTAATYTKRTTTIRYWLFGWHSYSFIAPIEYIYEQHSKNIREIFNSQAQSEISTLIAQNPKPALHVLQTKAEYIQSQKDLYKIYSITHDLGTQAAGTHTFTIPDDPSGSTQKAVLSTLVIKADSTSITYTLSGRTATYSLSASSAVTATYYVSLLKTEEPVTPTGGTLSDPDYYATYTDLTEEQIIAYGNANPPDYVEARTTSSTIKATQHFFIPQYTDTTWSAITASSTESVKALKDSTAVDLEVPIKIVDVSRDILESLATYVKKGLEGTGTDSGFVKYVEGEEKDGVPTGRSDSLYYKRWQIVNNRLNRTNGPLYKAANYLNNDSYIQEPKNYQENVRKSYKDFIEVLPIADISSLVYMKKEPATATTVEIPGKFYFEDEMEALAAEISSKCILTCNKCPQQKSCPFYNEEELVKLYCDECQTIDLWVKDNKLDLLYYSEGDVSSTGVVTNRSPYLVYTDSTGHTEELSHDLFKKIHRPYADIKKKVGASAESYTIQDLGELRTELSNRYPEFADDNRNSVGWLIGGRYGTVSVNNYANLDNDAYPDLVLPKYKYLYDAVFIEDEVSYIDYGESNYAYPVSVTITDSSNTEKTYTGTTKLQMPRSLKIFKNINPNSDVYLAADDTKDADNNDIVPLIYLGTVSSLQMSFDLQDDPASEERLTAIDTKLYAKDVAQWCVNEAKQACIYNPLDSQYDTNVNKDQYWMSKIKKRVVSEGDNTWLEIDGRKRASSGYQEPVIDPDSTDEAMTIAGKPLVNSYQDFLRKVSIRMNDGNGNDLIPWVKEGSGLDIEVQKSVLPLMKTNLRLAIVKST